MSEQLKHLKKYYKEIKKRKSNKARSWKSLLCL